MKKLFFLLAMAGGLTLSAQEAAQTPAAAQENISSMNQDVEAVEEISAADDMLNKLNEYAQKRGITYGTIDAKGRLYAYASCAVSKNAVSADFIKSRSMAFEKAYMDAIAALVMDSVGINIVKQTREIFNDQSSDKFEAPKDPAAAKDAMSKKVETLTEPQVDEALRKTGVDPKEAEGKSLLAKKQLFSDTLVQQAVKKAFGDASGVVPVNTFETFDAKGNYAIGVVVRSDLFSKEIGKCIAHRERPAISGKGKPVNELIPQDPKKLMTQFGVRIVYDETGTPSLLSFGQWGSSYTGNDARQAQHAIDAAKRQALANADANLTNFIRSKIAIEENSAIGTAETSQAMFKADGNTSVEETSNTIDKFFSSAKMEGNDTMSGRSTVKTVILKHPTGHKIVMVVRRWTFDQHENNQAMLQQKAESDKKEKSVKPQQKVSAEKDAGFRQGDDYDF